MIDFLNVIRGNIATDAGLTDIIPIQGMRNAPHLDFAGEIKTLTGFPTFHAAKFPTWPRRVMPLPRGWWTWSA